MLLTSRSKRRVGFEEDTLLLAPLLQLVLGKERVQFNLVDSGHNLPCLSELLEVGDRPVGNTNSLDLAGLVDLLHLAPGLGLVPGLVDRSCAIRVDGKKWV